jgi:hypothetical protein
MDLDKQINLEHLLFVDRQCRSCGKTKNLLDDFYLVRKDRGHFPSAYSYECKECTVKRITISRMISKIIDRWEYPDW